MRKHCLALLIAATAVSAAWGIEVTTTPGALQSLVTDHSVTQLTIKGQIDARDLLFVADSLKQLTQVDMSTVDIVAYYDDKPLFSTTTLYPAKGLPTATFAGKPLTNVLLPADLLTIGEAAFAGCDKLAAIDIPAQVDSIGGYAFSACTALTSVTLPASLSFLGNGAFAHCSALTAVTVASGGRLNHVGEEAFMDCNKLTTLSLGTNVVTIGHSAFAGTGLQALDLSAASKLATVGDWAMVNTNIANVKLPASVKSIGTGAMLYLPALTTVNMPDALQAVSDYLLTGSEQVNVIGALPEGLQTIGDLAFYNLNNLTSLRLPGTLNYIGTLAMAGMTSLEEITSAATTPPALGDNVWQGVDQPSVTLKVPLNSIELYGEAEQWQEFFIAPMAILGDVNGDGEVNVADISALVAVVMKTSTFPENYGRADINGDGEVGVADLTALVALVMSIKAPAVYPDVDDTITIDEVAIRPGETRDVAVRLTNSGNYNAMQFDLELPTGLSLAEAQVAGTHKVATDNDGRRVVVYSMTNDQLPADQVLTLRVTADRMLATDAEIVAENIVLADANNAAHYAPTAKAAVNNITGVNDLNDRADKVWAASGLIHIDAQEPGVAQIVAMNGTSVDVNVAAGHNQVEMPNGFYVVRIAGKSHKVVVD